MLEFPLLATQPLLQEPWIPSILSFLSFPLLMLCLALASPAYILLWLILRRGLRYLNSSCLRNCKGQVLLGLHLRSLPCWERIQSRGIGRTLNLQSASSSMPPISLRVCVENALSHFSQWLLKSCCAIWMLCKMDHEGDSRISSTHHPLRKCYQWIQSKTLLALLPFPFPSSFSLSPIDRILAPFHTFTTLFITGVLLPPLLLHPKGLQWCP